jgi:acetamidase/formamidase
MSERRPFVPTEPPAGTEHEIDPSIIHHEWDRGLEPALVVDSGDTVHFDCLPTGHGQVFPDSRAEDVQEDMETIYNLSGPVYVDGAEPGDTLAIEVLSLTPAAWGWTWIYPGLGLLADEFPERYLRVFDLTAGDHTMLGPDVRIPIDPFLGVMGVHPGAPEKLSPFPPHAGGGNLDNRYLTVGSTLYLPVHTLGARFSCGDAHAAQGDGEVCVTGLECGMKASLRFTVEKRTISVPQYRTPRLHPPSSGTAGWHATMGLDADLMEGTRTAVRGMIDWLVGERGLSREDAYVLCSLAGDLKILEVVDLGVWNVSMAMPLSIFV